MRILLFIVFFITGIKNENHDSEWTIKCDYLSNIYVYNSLELKKYNSKGDFMFRYSNTFMGDISVCDISDPFNVLVYFSDFKNILILDNNLNKKGEEINIEKYTDEEVDLICKSTSGDLYFYVSALNQVLRYSSRGELLDESILLSGMLNNTDIENMFIYKGVCYLIYNKNIVLKLDANLQYISKIYVSSAERLFLDGDRLYYLQGDNLYKYDCANGKSKQVITDKELNFNTIFIHQSRIVYYIDGLVGISKIK